MGIHLVTVVGSNINVLPHMLAHYAGLGVDSMQVNVHLERFDDPLFVEAQAVCREYGAEISSVFVGKWLQAVNPFLYEYTRRQKPDDWFLLADVDEFQVYPEDIRSFLLKMDRRGFDCVDGCLIDRVARDGSLPEVLKTKTIWEQFPLAGLLTYTILGANVLKVVAAKGHVKIVSGQHFAVGGKVAPRTEAFVPVHHFKWQKGVDARLRRRVDLFQQYEVKHWPESQRFLDYCARHDDKIDVDDPRFCFADSTTVYPLWNDVKGRILTLAKEHGL